MGAIPPTRGGRLRHPTLGEEGASATLVWSRGARVHLPTGGAPDPAPELERDVPMWRNRKRLWLVVLPLLGLLGASAAWVTSAPTLVSAAPAITGLKVT